MEVIRHDRPLQKVLDRDRMMGTLVMDILSILPGVVMITITIVAVEQTVVAVAVVEIRLKVVVRCGAMIRKTGIPTQGETSDQVQ